MLYLLFKVMSGNEVNVFIFVFIYLFLRSLGLEKLSLDNYKTIVTTDSILRNTTAKLFDELQYKNRSEKLKQALLVHNFFSSVTLKDHNTLNLIYEITRTERADNETERYLTALNDILNEDWNNTEADSSASNEDNILQYVDEFLSNLNGFKENGFDEAYETLDIKDEIIHILKSDDPSKFNPLLQNVTMKANSKEDSGYESDDEFWAPEKMTRRIYQGSKTKIKYFPFMASIHIFKGFQCAGSVIKSDLVITAASCLQLAWNNRFFRENPAFLSVRVGSNFYNGGGEDIAVLEVYFYPNYDPKNLRNNIAILRLVRHLKFRKHRRRVKKIDIDRNDHPLPMTTEGITIVGWGARGISNVVRDPWSNQLAYAVLDVYHLQECQEIYSREYVTRTNFCAGFISKGGGACNHDVGGPGVVNGILTGIISFGSPVCGTPDAPTVFTKVGYYADWIEEIMDQEVPSGHARTTLRYPEFPVTSPPAHEIPTTFKIYPVKKLTPIPLIEADKLRMLEDEDLFKEFLTTMFNSKEANEYKDLLFNDFPVKKTIDEPVVPEVAIEKPVKKDKPKIILKEQAKIDITEVHEKPNPKKEEGLHELSIDEGYHTKMDMYQPKNKKAKQDKQRRFTVFNMVYKNDDEENVEDIEKNIVKLIDNIDLSETEEKIKPSKEIKREREGAIEPIGTQLFGDFEFTTKPVLTEPRENNQMRKDNVLTLLYISDNEVSNNTLGDIGNLIDDFEDDASEGMSIEVEPFTDLTFRSNNTSNKERSKSVLDFMSRSELYDLLSEAIDEVTKYNKKPNKRS